MNAESEIVTWSRWSMYVESRLFRRLHIAFKVSSSLMRMTLLSDPLIISSLRLFIPAARPRSSVNFYKTHPCTSKQLFRACHKYKPWDMHRLTRPASIKAENIFHDRQHPPEFLCTRQQLTVILGKQCISDSLIHCITSQSIWYRMISMIGRAISSPCRVAWKRTPWKAGDKCTSLPRTFASCQM